MKRALLVLLVTASPAVAAPEPIELSFAPLGELPSLAASEESCEYPGWIQTRRRTISGVEIQSLHGCGATDETSELAIGSGGVWFMAPGTTVAYQAANMTEAPMHIRMLSDSLQRGTTADGSPAVVLRIDLRFAAICMREGCADAAAWREQWVTVCPLATMQTREPFVACGSVRHRCPASGCREVTLARGTLAVFDEAGPRWFRLSD